MDTRLSVKVCDINGILDIVEYVEFDKLDDFILNLDNIYDSCDIEINNIWFYVDELKDLVATKSFSEPLYQYLRIYK